MILLILLILTLFSLTWLFVWYLFFKTGKSDVNLFKGGSKALENGNYKKAKELFAKLVKLNGNIEAKFKLGLTQINLGEYDEAKATFEQILKSAPKNYDALITLAEINTTQKNYDAALELYNKALAENPTNLDCNIKISDVYYKKSDFKQALDLLEQAKELAPENTQIKFSIIKCKSKLCNMDSDEECLQILEEYSKIADLPDLPPEFDIAYAKAFAINGNINKSFEHCQKSLQKLTDDIETYQLLGLISLIKQDFDGAKSNLTIALNFEQNNKETHNIFSYVLCQTVTSCTLSKCRERYFKLIRNMVK